jgi:hypothetical protein
MVPAGAGGLPDHFQLALPLWLVRLRNPSVFYIIGRFTVAAIRETLKKCQGIPENISQ